MHRKRRYVLHGNNIDHPGNPHLSKVQADLLRLSNPDNILRGIPAELYIKNLTITGQGTIGLKFQAKEGFRIVLNSEEKQSDGKEVLVLDIGKEVTYFRKRNNNEKTDILASTKEKKALLDDHMVLYWFSLDKNNRRLRYGKGPMQSQLTVFSYNFPQKKSQENDDYAWIEDLRYIAVCYTAIKTEDFGEKKGKKPEIELSVWNLPVTVDLPPFIIKRENATLEKLEMEKATVIDNLPKKCQELYWNVVDVSLNTPDFPDFADAIEYSIKTPGLRCYEKLKEKAKNAEFGNSKATYLRVTLGEDRGNSPGIPYVLEIWPSGHYSPVHSHSNSFAIIKVLYNEIMVRYYAGLKEEKWYNEVPFQQGQITWISDKHYQTHQLWNRTRKVCVTIQCYQYGDDDHNHYEYFDYIGSNGVEKRFKPNSDWPFAEFQKLIKEEWKKHKYISDD
ncbi:6158_t:CDS:2 [Ambispora leptoticha]|uniref:6158_t:CDS:1 n=1 Tax=Ambispora leptoticha TaxID=144679 RepID=A0A9N9D518_9GLOM|nr:6158_t:CDS:2 [Ambispora leptoticha]